MKTDQRDESVIERMGEMSVYTDKVQLRVWPVYLATTLLITTLWFLSKALVPFLFWLGAERGLSVHETYERLMPWFSNVPIRVLLYAAPYGLLIGFPLAAAVRSKSTTKQRLQWSAGREPIWVLFLLAAASPMAAQGMEAVRLCIANYFPLPSAQLDRIHNLISSAKEGEWWWMFFIVCIIGPVLEELFFRGFVQRRLVARKGPVRGILISSILFGIYHLDPVHSSMAILMGIYLGYAAWRTESIRTSIVCHITVNTIAFFLSFHSNNLAYSSKVPLILILDVIDVGIALYALNASIKALNGRQLNRQAMSGDTDSP